MNTANIIIKTALALSVMTAGAVTSVYADTDGDVRRVILLDEGWKFGKRYGAKRILLLLQETGYAGI